MLAAVGNIAFRLELLPEWKIQNVFHVSQLKSAVGFDATGRVADDCHSVFRPLANTDGEYEVEDILDHRQHGRGRYCTT